MRFALFLFALALSQRAFPARLASVRPLEVENRAAIGDPVLRSTLEQLKLEPFNAKKNPELVPFQQKIGQLLASLLEEKDGSDPIDFVLVDDARPNAAFFESSKTGKRIVFLNVGTLKFVKNDDELAYILSHELEHRTAALQSHADEAKTRIEQSLYQRAVENEVDAKGAVGRLEKHGFNPYAAIDFLARMEEHSPSGLSESHSSTASRKHTTSLALVYQAREGGADSKMRMDSERRTNSIIKEVQQTLSTAALQGQTRARLSRFAANPPAEGIEALYRSVRDGTPGLFTDLAYANKYKEVLADADRFGLKDLSRAEQVEFQLDLHHGLSDTFQAARARALPESFSATTPQQFKLLRNLDRRPIVLDVPELFPSAAQLKQAEKWLNDVKLDLAGDNGQGLTTEDLSTAEHELAEKQAAYHDAKLAFHTDPGFDERVDKALAENRANYSLALRAEDFEKNKFELKRIVGTVRQTAEQTKKLHASHESIIFAKKGHVTGVAEELESIYLMPDRAKQLSRFFDRYLGQMAEDMAKKGAEEKAEYPSTHLYNWWDSAKEGSRSPRQALADLHAVDPRASDLTVQRMFAQAEGATPKLKMQSFLKLFLESLPITCLQEAEVRIALEKSLSIARIEAIAGSSNLEGLKNALTEAQAIESMLSTLDPKRRISAPVWQAAVEKIRAFNPSLSPAQADAYAFVKLPALRERAPKLSPATLRQNTLSLAEPPASMAKQFSFEELVSALDGRMSPQELFSLLDLAEPLLNDAMPLSPPNSLNTALKPETREAYAQWLVDQLGDASARTDPRGARLIRVIDSPIVGEYFSARLEKALSRNEKAAPNQKVAKAAAEFFGEIPDSIMAKSSSLDLKPAFARGRIANAGRPLSFVNQIREAAKAYVADHPLPKENFFGADSRARKLMDKGGAEDFLRNPSLAAQENSTEKIRFFQDTFADSRFPSRKLDEWFERIWIKEAGNPEFASFFANPELIKQLSYQDNQIKVARWQLEAKFGLAEKSHRLKSRGAQFPVKNAIREELPAIINEIEARFPEVSAPRNELIDFVQSSLLTSEAESRLLAPLKLSTANWHQSSQVQAIDAPQQVAKMLKSPREQLSLIRYLIGTDDAPPPIKVQYVDMNESLRDARAHFQKSDINVRTYALQPLLDDQSGLFAQPETAAEVYRLVLGDHHEHPLTSKIFHAYLDSLPSSERTAVLGRILAGMSGRGEGAASLKSILEAMGPFGIKAGQFLRTTGLLPEVYRLQLDDFFDGARPVPREQIFDRLKEVFGKNLQRVEAMGPTVGSGSINYAVLADIVDPANGKPKRVVVRVLRDSVEGQVRNENAIWEKVTGRLKADPDLNARRAGSLLEEARAHAFENLRAGGVELDLKKARGQEEAAKRAYSRAPQRPNGLRLEAASAVPSIQELIGSPYQSSISVQEFVPNTRYKEIPLPRRSEVGTAVTLAEMEALFVHGEFDPDGHPGNWLYDEAQHRVVRIDYDQMRKIPPAELPAVRRAFATLVSPDAGNGMARALTNEADSIFRFSKPLTGNDGALLSTMNKIVQRPDFPSFTAPHERLLFLQDHLQKELASLLPELEVHLRSSVQSSLASLGRIAIYRETIGDVAFGKILLKTLGVNPIAHG